jgi:thioredoxin reductase (NADPH)
VIIAAGAEHRKLGMDGEERLTGAGVSYCAVCDGAFFKGQRVAVIGGGNSALVDAVLLSDGCEKVYIVQNLPFLTGESRLQKTLSERENVEIILSSVVTKIVGGDTLRAVEIKNVDTDEMRSLSVEGMFVAVGHAPENSAFESILDLDEQGYIISGEDCVPKGAPDGIFVAGDCRTKAIRQVTTATADGAVAALAAIRFLDS